MLRGTTKVRRFLAGATFKSTAENLHILHRNNGRTRRSLWENPVGARLRDHVQRGNPYPFPAAGTLCYGLRRLLFSSLSLWY